MALMLALAIGIAFGFTLERAGLGSAPKLAGQFYFTDFTVMKVMFTAIVVAMTGAFWLGRIGAIDLRSFLGIDPAVPQGYESLNYVVRIKGSGTKEEFAEIHEAVMATSPNFYNVSRPVALKPTLVVE